MRSDMQKVIVSRPRSGGGGKRKTSKQGGREPMRPRGHNNKQQTDLLGPLKKFLHKRAGQLWNDIWSEICEHADYRSMMGDHLRRHVDQMVRKPTLGQDGQLYDESGRVFDTASPYFYREFYVDPRDGKLHAVQIVRNHHKETPVKKVFQIDGKQYHKHDDLWYRVEMMEIPDRRWKNQQHCSFSDEFNKFGDYAGTGDWYGWLLRDKLKAQYGLSPNGLYWYCTSKQSANSKEIRKLHNET